MTSKQDIITAIKHIDKFLRVPELMGAIVRLNSNGNPYMHVGGFNMVFQLTNNDQKWALRIWHASIGESKERFQKISNYLSQCKLPYFAQFIYDQNGILINGKLVDTIRMEWMEGILLKDYIRSNLNKPLVLLEFAKRFLKMAKDLRINRISHGDLQEGNILVNSNGEIILVDYDSLCVPEIEGEKDFITGLKGYQHPSRFTSGQTSFKADYFSELIIYLSIISVAAKPELWTKYQVNDTQYLLFTELDFENLEASSIYNDLKGLSSDIDSLLNILKEYLKTSSYLDLRPFPDYLEPPKVKFFSCSNKVIIQSMEIVLSWEVENAIKVIIDNEINEVDNIGNKTLKPIKSAIYTLTAIGFEKTEIQSLEVIVYPTPIIQSISVPTINYEKVTYLSINCPKHPGVELGIKEVSNDINVDLNFPSIESKIQFQSSSESKRISAIDIDSFSISTILKEIPKI